MEDEILYIVMVGLPARGKSTIASKLRDNLIRDGIRTRIFNNGDLRRKLFLKDTSHSGFYDPKNREGVALREKIALTNIRRAKDYMGNNGQVAILDATNVSIKRRKKTTSLLGDHTILFIECVNEDKEILEASILRKINLPEFKHLRKEEAVRTFKERIRYYQSIYKPLKGERNFVRLDSLKNQILAEEIAEDIPYYDRI
ncbi:MAG: AAA family ATPase, partial [Deltaproteobacteria bacterium]|nr:AAA family ATPase [Deltaproteobacteria bacterium]